MQLEPPEGSLHHGTYSSHSRAWFFFKVQTILAMSSQPKKSWKKVFSLRPDGSSSGSAGDGSAEGTVSQKDDTHDCDEDSLASTKPPSYRSQTSVTGASGEKVSSKDQIYCSACGTKHHLSSFPDLSTKTADHQRRCIGSKRILYLCAHAFMTWDQFRREIVDIFPYHEGLPSNPGVLTITYARDTGLSTRDAVMRHMNGSHCQSWEGEWYGVAKPAPWGGPSFQMRPENKICWYSTFHIAVQEVWCVEAESVVEGRGPAPVKPSWSTESESKTKYSKKGLVSKEPLTLEQMVPLLAERLNSLEIYLCPHVNFFSPVLKLSLIFLLANKFVDVGHGTMNPRCEECGSSFTIYVQKKSNTQTVDQVTIIISRVVGTGINAMESEWLNATEERGKAYM